MPTLGADTAWLLPPLRLLMPLLLLLLPSPWSLSGTAEGARILAVPADGSHWPDMKTLLAELARHGHAITVLRISGAWFVDGKSDDFLVENVEIPGRAAVSREEALAAAERWILDTAFAPRSSWFGSVSAAVAEARAARDAASDMSAAIEATLGDGALMARLRESRFDAVLGDTLYPGGPMVARALGLPVALLGRWEVGGDVQQLLAPAPLSYVPALGSRYSDRMSFSERLDNALRSWGSYVLNRVLVYPAFDRLCARFLGAGVSYEQLYRRADVVLLTVDFALEYARPGMPNLAYVGGLRRREPRPLSGALAALYAAWAPRGGVVVASFGPLVRSLPPRVADELARAFARLPLGVAWAHAGPRPAGLGNNTLALPRLPVRDLLAHGATRAFVSHGGDGAAYEAVRHGVPLLGVPMYGEQGDNVARLEERGAALSAPGGRPRAITADGFSERLRRLVDEPRFAEAMRRLSRLHRDTPVPPLDLATFWVEFVARNGGAPHLRAAGLEMPAYRRGSLDVALAVAVAAIVVLAVAGVAVVRVKRRLCRPEGRPQRE